MQGSLDADRLASLHVPGDAGADVRRASAASATWTRTWSAPRCPSIPLEEIDLLVIENVGNLVCPAEFRVGEDARVMVASVTEGEDKPLKYPLMFRACELVVLNKIDLLPHVDFDVDKWAQRLQTVHPGVPYAAGERAHGRGRGRVPRLARGAAGAAHGGGVTPERTRANGEFFAAESERLAALCDEMALRFLRGGRLLAVGESPTRATSRSSSSIR